MTRHLLIVLSLMLLTQPVLAAPAKPSTLCTFLGETAVDAARQRDAGWSLTASLDDVKPSIARASETLKARYAETVRAVYASTLPPGVLKAQIFNACMAPYKQTTPPTPSGATQRQKALMTPLEQCTWFGYNAELYAQARDSGIALTQVLAWIDSARDKGQTQNVISALAMLALNIYKNPQETAVEARRAREIFCIDYYRNN